MPAEKVLQHTGCIRALYRTEQKKAPAIEEETLILTEQVGIEGDCHANGGERQLSLLTMEEKDWMEQQETEGFCFRKFKENILLDQISLKNCQPGDILVCGEAQIELSAFVKRCQWDLCRLAKEKVDCPFKDSVRFAQVKKSGLIEKGMNVWLYRQNEYK